MATPIRAIRVPDELWKAAQARAARIDPPLSVTHVVLDALCRFAFDRGYCPDCGGPCTKPPALLGPDDPF